MRRILIVDDHVGPSMMLADLLRGVHSCVDIAYSATGAVNHLDAIGSELVILNLTMADLEGWKVLDYIRSLPSDRRPGVIVHSKLTDAQWERAKVWGAEELWITGECSFWSMCDSLDRHFEHEVAHAA